MTGARVGELGPCGCSRGATDRAVQGASYRAGHHVGLLDDGGRAGKSEVDANQPVARSTEDLLRHRSRETRCCHDAQELALQPTVRAGDDLTALEHVKQLRDAVPTASAERGDPPVQEILADQPVSQCAGRGRRTRGGRPRSDHWRTRRGRDRRGVRGVGRSVCRAVRTDGTCGGRSGSGCRCELGAEVVHRSRRRREQLPALGFVSRRARSAVVCVTQTGVGAPSTAGSRSRAVSAGRCRRGSGRSRPIRSCPAG